MIYSPKGAAIKKNSIRCLKCGEEIESTHRHDFKYCRCRNVFVDGGKDYLRRGYSSLAWQDTSEFEEDKEELVEMVSGGGNESASGKKAQTEGEEGVGQVGKVVD